MGHASKSDGLLHLEASRVRVSPSSLKTCRGAMTGDACGIIVDVVLSES
jgi:hypothetical protein